MTRHDANKALIAPLRAALRSADRAAIRGAINAVFAPDAQIRLGHPLGEMVGPEALWDQVYAPLLDAMPDLERADFIVMAGPRWGQGKTGDWVGLGGNFIGKLTAPWLRIPATGRPAFMRYHEYLRISDGKIVEMEGLWDIPQLMIQAGAWPMPDQAGVEWMCPGPSTGQGVITAPHDATQAAASVQAVWDMLHDLKKGDAQTPDRGLGGHWHPNAPWYGSAGIGSARGHAGIRDVVLKAFREGLSDNTRHLDEGVFFGDHDFVAFTGWPSGTATHSGEGFLGLKPTGIRFTRRSLDFWRIEDGRIRENWVMVDLLDIYRQLGVDVLAQMCDQNGGSHAA
ncbi:ester cyclase [Shimia ponticola]|uniref:ester cyclase n=1 Tax=Shimia ponticola TaxID=2582893 RepID=UPI0011BD9975|nr:ester cyclase [Shimia ponticola]